MKKIISVLLILATVLALGSCKKEPENKEKTPVENVRAMFERSDPTRTMVTTTQDLGDIVLHGTALLIRGEIDGKSAAVYTYEYEKMAGVEEESKTPVVTVSGSKEYVYGRGVRENLGKWDGNADDFTPDVGGFALNLVESAMQDVKYEDHVLTFKVPAEKATVIFGEDTEIDADTFVTVTDDESYITSVTLSYTGEFYYDAEADEPETSEIVLKAVYTYDLENLTLLTK